MLFTGTVDAKSDSKGRIFLPAQFRRVMHETEQTEFVLARSAFERCLVVYPRGAWDERLAELRERVNRWNAAEMRLMRQFVADVVVFSLDASGRMLVPKRFMQYAGIAAEVTFIGLDDTIELWARGAAEGLFVEPDVLRSGLESLMAGGDGGAAV